MPLSQLLNLPCTITRRTPSADDEEINDYGDPVQNETEVDTVCELQQRARSEDDLQGELSDTSWLLILPAGTAIDTGDAVTIDGKTYELVGDPWQARNPRTETVEHIEATLRRTA